MSFALGTLISGSPTNHSLAWIDRISSHRSAVLVPKRPPCPQDSGLVYVPTKVFEVAGVGDQSPSYSRRHLWSLFSLFPLTSDIRQPEEDGAKATTEWRTDIIYAESLSPDA
jgi:hypothetical protein